MTTGTDVEMKSTFCLRLHTDIDIAASAERVWEILTDFQAYETWNPAIPRAAGSAIPGTMLDVDIHWPGLKRGRYKLRVLEAETNRRLRWLGRFLVPALMDGNHVFVLEPLAGDRCRVTQEEDFIGLIVPIFRPWLTQNVLDGFKQINEAMARRAEAESQRGGVRAATGSSGNAADNAVVSGEDRIQSLAAGGRESVLGSASVSSRDAAASKALRSGNDGLSRIS